MRTIRIKLYKFNELSADAQSKAIDNLRDLNVDYDYWDSTYEDFKMLCAEIGIDVDLKKTYFSGFSSQGDGAGFSANINIIQLIEGIKGKKYLEHAPEIEKETRLRLSDCDVDRRVIQLIRSGVIDIYASTSVTHRYYSSKLDFSSNYSYNECVNYNRIDSEIYKLESWIEDVVSELDSCLYRLLENEYEYQTSDEAIKESIISNDYEFTVDGEMA